MGVRRYGRHRRGRPRVYVAAGLASVLAATYATTATTAAAGPPPRSAAAPRAVAPMITDKQVADAVAKLGGQIRAGMEKTGVPGVAVAVVHKDKVVYLKGFGEREVGKAGAVSPDTVFQLASLSKPVASTVVADAVGDKALDWGTPVTRHLPDFALKDAWVTRHVTVADLMSHRSGLPDHAGDLLEDLGYDQQYILGHLRFEPLSPFRASYAYTNFGFTAAAEAVADAKDTTWEKLAEDSLYRPARMTATSSSFADYEKAANKAVTHVENAQGHWEAKFVRDADAQSPAGGVSSTARDMTRWLRLQLANGKLAGEQIVPAEQLQRTHLPEIVSQPPAPPTDRAGFYGLGWNVSYDDQGRLRLSHSGAFGLGANTSVTMLPAEQLGIVVLTNGSPVGLADSVAFNFFDTAQQGGPTQDWLSLIGQVYEKEEQAGRSPTDYTKPPSGAADARADDVYTGTYRNDYYGPLTVTADDGALSLHLGRKPLRFALTHYSGDTFSFETVGENAVGRTGVTFTVGDDGQASRVKVESLDTNGLGTFTRE
ncbi:CubicO group peptidase (beta-lactamase class C family) [Streptomyces sp. V4I23]|uniref:serine hydrolase n=1 Tax=Streptomyces sp. V4I23 TaxID=3042282 RepID=UPI002789D738|nr:serine hydrolase [Streptomyces sp. V4I23]MDQ1010009.1 CubicO group peptidase (beta-lactamase class C family) [Streptomyces sp. V4I23]